MRPELQTLLKSVNCAPAIRETHTDPDLAVIIAMCRDLVGLLNVHGLAPLIYDRAAEIAAEAEVTLPSAKAFQFHQLKNIREWMPESWTFIDLGACVDRIAREAVIECAKMEGRRS